MTLRSDSLTRFAYWLPSQSDWAGLIRLKKLQLFNKGYLVFSSMGLSRCGQFFISQREFFISQRDRESVIKTGLNLFLIG